MLTSQRQKPVKTLDNSLSESRDELCNPIRSVRAREFDRDLIKIMESAHRWAEMVSDERLIAQLLLCEHKILKKYSYKIPLLFDKTQHHYKCKQALIALSCLLPNYEHFRFQKYANQKFETTIHSKSVVLYIFDWLKWTSSEDIHLGIWQYWLHWSTGQVRHIQNHHKILAINI